jgi:hypothetical protein
MRDVLIEAGEETKSVLPWQRGTALASGSLDVYGTRLSTDDSAPFDDLDTETSFDEFVRGAQTSNATAKNENAFRKAVGASGVREKSHLRHQRSAACAACAVHAREGLRGFEA